MFTGIIECLGEVVNVERKGGNLELLLMSPITHELKIDQSLAHNGVCLTVVEVSGDEYRVTAIQETLDKSNLGALKPGDLVNLERCMPAHGRFDGHIVQGHVDCTGKVVSVQDEDGSWRYTISFDSDEGNTLIVSKGSVTVNGVSLTVAKDLDQGFELTIIPYTHEYTNFHLLKPGDEVNIEFDIIGKYAAKMLGKNN